MPMGLTALLLCLCSASCICACARSKHSATGENTAAGVRGIKLWIIDALYTRISTLRFQALHEQRMDDAAMEMSTLTPSDSPPSEKGAGEGHYDKVAHGSGGSGGGITI